MKKDLSHINSLENEAIFILREVAAQFDNPVLLRDGKIHFGYTSFF